MSNRIAITFDIFSRKIKKKHFTYLQLISVCVFLLKFSGSIHDSDNDDEKTNRMSWHL